MVQISFTTIFAILFSLWHVFPAKVPLYQTQVSELYEARFVMLHDPGLEVELAALHPAGALFEPHGASSARAHEAHNEMRRTLHRFGVETRTIREVLRSAPRTVLINLAAGVLEYRFKENATFAEKSGIGNAAFISESYKKRTLSHLSLDELINIVFTRPTVTLVQSAINTPVTTVSTSFAPLGNLVFTRDQQITTAKGVVMGNLNSFQRQAESRILKLCWDLLRVPVLASVADLSATARLEGGDFFSLGTRSMFHRRWTQNQHRGCSASS